MSQKDLELAFLQKMFSNEEEQHLLETANENFFSFFKKELKIIKDIYLKLHTIDGVELSKNIEYDRLMKIIDFNPLFLATTAETILSELKEKFYMKEFTKSISDIYKKSVAGEIDLTEAIAMVEKTKEFSVFEEKSSELKDLYAEGIVRITESKEEQEGIRTGIDNIDNILKRGILPNNYVVIGARPGCGKTALALQIAINNVLRNKKVLYITMEMGDNEIVEYRIMENLLEMPYESIKKALKDDKVTSERLKIYQMEEKLKSLKGMLFETKIKNNRELMKKIKAKIIKEKLDLVVVDYIGLVRPAEKSSYSREREVAEVSENLKAITNEYQTPIICLTQLNRGGADGEPTGSNIRESDSLLNDANKVLLLWNNVEETEKLEGNNTVLECKIEKNREGGQGITKLLFKKDIQKIVSYKEMEE